MTLALVAQDHLPAPATPPAAASSELSQPAAENSGAAASRMTRNPSELEQGRKLFEVHCAFCHGPGGEGAKGPTLAQPTLPRASDDASLVRIIREGIGGTEMPRARMERQDVERVVAFVKSLGSRPVERVPGDPDRGAVVYATKGACAPCHAINGKGGVFGPDLTEVGRRRSVAYLRRSLTDPGAEVPQSFSPFRQDIPLPENFLYVRVFTRDGDEIAGVRANEDTFSIQVRDATGRVHSFFKDAVVEVRKEFGISPMPSYVYTLTKDELDDLVAYLVSLRGQK
jgi:putative heme-binding domain-containing protein